MKFRSGPTHNLFCVTCWRAKSWGQKMSMARKPNEDEWKIIAQPTFRTQKQEYDN
jgi:hypothetical protein